MLDLLEIISIGIEGLYMVQLMDKMLSKYSRYKSLSSLKRKLISFNLTIIILFTMLMIIIWGSFLLF